ncbi:MAG: alpha/beta hydrolase [Candidatus Omnitrophica bacterium]|nr:alpha/beta hydrolase [Candidatus Omnitrophota bacterium]
MKNMRWNVLSRAVAVPLCFSFLLTGCASFPVQTGAKYAKDLYRRIPYKVEGQYRVINVFYATDRVVEEKKDSSLSFKHKMAKGMTYGDLTVKIDPSIKIGKMLPRRLKMKGEIGIQEIARLNDDVFIKQLTDAVAASPHNSLLVMVFGYKDDFEATAIKAAYFSYLLDVNTPVLLFDWPGDQPFAIAGYFTAQSCAKESGPYLGELLTTIIRKVKPEKLWVKASSLGCQVVCDAFDHMYKYDDLSDADMEIDHVILAAPDVGQNEFDNQFKDELAALSKKLTTYVSSNDTALLMSGMLNQEKRLGRQKEVPHEQFDEAKDLLYLKSLHPDRITVIDVTPINVASYKHGYYLECPEFYDDFYMRIFDKDPNVNRRLYLLTFKDKVDYWVLQNDK